MDIPQHLSGNYATGEFEGQCVAQFEIGDYKNFVYLILDWNQRKAAIIDPQYDLSAPLGCLKRHGFELVATFLTHTHFDHVAGVPQLVKSYPHVPIILHRDDLHRLDSQVMDHGRTQIVSDGDVIPIGELEIQVLHTPGHSSGESSYLLKGKPAYLFSGDTVFIRDCGRTDLATGSTEEMYRSLQRIKRLPPETILLPGHHYQPECASTLGRESKDSPPFKCKSVEELAALP
jgi:glyoxylase-like metal-dependent hydrolase (beta-lactamase superfamily II)